VRIFAVNKIKLTVVPGESDSNNYTILGTYVIDSEDFCANDGHFFDFCVVASVK
jgi:hypothetical protein